MNKLIHIFIQQFVIFIQKLIWRLKLKNRKKINEIIKFDLKKHKYILIYVGFKNKFDNSDLALINEHQKKSAYIVYVTNFKEFERSEDCSVDLFINNNNEGWDFAMYKTATLYLLESLDELPEKILYINDSCYYFGDASSKFFDKFFDKKYDFIAPFEVTLSGIYSPWHLSAWCFSVSKEFFLSLEYLNFWNCYYGIPNKNYAIRNGEHQLTKVALIYSGKVKAIYDYNKILEKLSQKLKIVGYNDLKRYLSQKFMVDFHSCIDHEKVRCDSDRAYHLRDFLQTRIHKYFSAHVFGIFLIEFEHFPFLKKDIFFFSGQSYDNLRLLESVLKRKYGEQISLDCINSILLRGRYSDATQKMRFKYFLGLR